MKKFLKNTILFLIGFVTLISIGYLLPENNAVQSNDYAIIDKHKLLEENKNPRIILAGGSNVSFGFNSERIEKELNVNVINTAIHAGYGLKYIIDDLKPYINEGDIIILSPEYSHFYGDAFLGKEPLLYSLCVKPSNIKHLSFKQIINVLNYTPKYSLQRIRSFAYNILKKGKTNSVNFVYQRNSNNKYGDVVTHWGLPKVDFKPYPIDGLYNENTIEYIKKFAQYVSKKKAKLIISYPSLCESSFKINYKQIEFVENIINKSNLKVFGTPKLFSYKDNYYYNTPYHLRKEGAEIRTNKHIEYLKKNISND